eukprot:SAG11_NODE_1130_length_5761_cov_12.098728_2_plen_545_part_00
MLAESKHEVWDWAETEARQWKAVVDCQLACFTAMSTSSSVANEMGIQGDTSGEEEFSVASDLSLDEDEDRGAAIHTEGWSDAGSDDADSEDGALWQGALWQGTSAAHDRDSEGFSDSEDAISSPDVWPRHVAGVGQGGDGPVEHAGYGATLTADTKGGEMQRRSSRMGARMRAAAAKLNGPRAVLLGVACTACIMAFFSMQAYCKGVDCSINSMQTSLLGMETYYYKGKDGGIHKVGGQSEKNSTIYDDIAFHYHGWYQRYISDTVGEHDGISRSPWASNSMHPSAHGIQLPQSGRTRIVEDFDAPTILGGLHFRPPADAPPPPPPGEAQEGTAEEMNILRQNATALAGQEVLMQPETFHGSDDDERELTLFDENKDETHALTEQRTTGLTGLPNTDAEPSLDDVPSLSDGTKDDLNAKALSALAALKKKEAEIDEKIAIEDMSRQEDMLEQKLKYVKDDIQESNAGIRLSSKIATRKSYQATPLFSRNSDVEKEISDSPSATTASAGRFPATAVESEDGDYSMLSAAFGDVADQVIVEWLRNP